MFFAGYKPPAVITPDEEDFFDSMDVDGNGHIEKHEVVSDANIYVWVWKDKDVKLVMLSFDSKKLLHFTSSK